MIFPDNEKKGKKGLLVLASKEAKHRPGAAESSSRILIARGAAIADVAHAADQHVEVRLRLTFLLLIAPKLTFYILGRARKARGVFATNCKIDGRRTSIKMRSFIGEVASEREFGGAKICDRREAVCGLMR